ncbi:hypothetical protein LVD15_19515 [Fulvivirga maritima]|uniref:hypothetical protein n=1 Tax=Fulvivirga maritima TaxID=2904247 RepID=UPI001F36B11C|nr:hypothetical protein [Fulvivirga maritima]UII25474.1 hypothetical protein LVD15_19515 [Fulvivirga maritima]
MINYYIDIMVTKEMFDGFTFDERYEIILTNGVFLKECHHFEKLLKLYKLENFLVEACFNDKHRLIQVEVISHRSAMFFYGISDKVFSASITGGHI